VLLDLAGGGAREVGDHVEAPRHLVGGQALAAEGLELAAVERGHPLDRQDEGAADLAPSGVRHRHHRDLGHGRVGAEHVLDLGRVDVLAARDEHLLPPPRHIVEAVGIAAGKVA
jgi:hypothetical protein